MRLRIYALAHVISIKISCVGLLPFFIYIIELRFHLYLLEIILHIKLILPITFFILETYANSEYLDEMPQKAIFHQGLHCLLRQN